MDAQQRLSVVDIYDEKGLNRETLELRGVNSIAVHGKTVVLSDINSQIFALNVTAFRPVS
jgi:hypothetical protein